MNKTTEALKLAEALENDAKEHREVSYGLDCLPERTANWKHALNCEAAARLIREALAEPVKQEPVAFKFVRYVNGKEMAEGVTIERETTLDAAIKKAVSLCPDRAKTVLVYAAPVSAKREWVDLTLIELAEAFVDKGNADAGIRAVIAAFKEKNRG